ncbi:MAG: IS66 family transposase [Candidatus Sumerlaeia bacterium]|nr:IS66 family transposase [Candidatus Sumerlaeia bacterium]
MTPELLLAQLESEKAARAEAEKLVAEQAEQIAHLAAQVAWFRRHVFGSTSEKNVLPPPPDSPQLDIFGNQGEATPGEIREETAEPKKEQARKAKPRRPLPKDLPRHVVMHDLAEEQKRCACCGKVMCRIGEDVTEKLQLVPAKLYIEQHVRPRYACGACKDAVAQAPLPAFPIPRATAGASLLAFLLLSKYADHTPLCRMERTFARHGIDLPRRKTSAWMMELSGLCKPLVALMQRRIVERSAVVGADETPIQMLDPQGGRRKTKTCFLWQYRGDEQAPYTVFDFREGRGRDGPREVLRDFRGILQCDAYAVYQSLRTAEGLAFTQAGCWAHARRKFVEAHDGGDRRAETAIAIIGELYAVEKHAREQRATDPDFDDAALARLRQERSVPALARLREWMDGHLAVLPKSPLGKAIGYTLDNWAMLTLYAADGRVPIDNNAVERSIRPVALGRKNWLFAGSERGGQAAALFFSLIASARRADLNLWDYTTDLLTRLPSHPVNRLDDLLPDNWPPHTP